MVLSQLTRLQITISQETAHATPQPCTTDLRLKSTKNAMALWMFTVIGERRGMNFFTALLLSISLGKVLSTFGDYAKLSVKIGGHQHRMAWRVRIYVMFPLSIASLSIIPFLVLIRLFSRWRLHNDFSKLVQQHLCHWALFLNWCPCRWLLRDLLAWKSELYRKR